MKDIEVWFFGCGHRAILAKKSRISSIEDIEIGQLSSRRLFVIRCWPGSESSVVPADRYDLRAAEPYSLSSALWFTGPLVSQTRRSSYEMVVVEVVG